MDSIGELHLPSCIKLNLTFSRFRSHRILCRTPSSTGKLVARKSVGRSGCFDDTAKEETVRVLFAGRKVELD